MNYNFLTYDEILYKTNLDSYEQYMLLNKILEDYDIKYFKKGILYINKVDSYTFDLYILNDEIMSDIFLDYLVTYKYESTLKIKDERKKTCLLKREDTIINIESELII